MGAGVSPILRAESYSPVVIEHHRVATVWNLAESIVC